MEFFFTLENIKIKVDINIIVLKCTENTCFYLNKSF